MESYIADRSFSPEDDEVTVVAGDPDHSGEGDQPA